MPEPTTQMLHGKNQPEMQSWPTRYVLDQLRVQGLFFQKEGIVGHLRSIDHILTSRTSEKSQTANFAAWTSKIPMSHV